MEHLLKEAANAAQQEDSLERLTSLAAEYKEAKALVDEKEQELKSAKALFNKISMEQIPELLSALGIAKVELEDGSSVQVQEEISVSVKDYDKFYAWLQARGDEAIVKTTLEAGKMPKEILAKLVKKIHDDFGILCEAKYNVHNMTLKSYIKKLCGINGKTEAQVNVAELDEDMLSTFVYYKTTIK